MLAHTLGNDDTKHTERACNRHHNRHSAQKYRCHNPGLASAHTPSPPHSLAAPWAASLEPSLSRAEALPPASSLPRRPLPPASYQDPPPSPNLPGKQCACRGAQIFIIHAQASAVTAGYLQKPVMPVSQRSTNTLEQNLDAY